MKGDSFGGSEHVEWIVEEGGEDGIWFVDE